jgi:Tat protein secretion system quality control protein TatD with DNase activity
VTYRNVRNLIDVVKFVPDDRLLIETDCPYLTPELSEEKETIPAGQAGC